MKTSLTLPKQTILSFRGSFTIPLPCGAPGPTLTLQGPWGPPSPHFWHFLFLHKTFLTLIFSTLDPAPKTDLGIFIEFFLFQNCLNLNPSMMGFFK